ncbi:MFS transporter [Phlyctema vagabunda]|uniref:MFS transporter n=1 Tax=Phlyctema vagabunda TaxID=108571 RepID=A0ABR4P6J7_9HELO
MTTHTRDGSVKAAVDHVDDVEANEKAVLPDGQPDQFGSYAKMDAREVALVRKIDFFMMPILWLMYFMNFLDRNAMINGKLNGLDKDLKLKGTQYQTCVSILFVGYLAGQVPSNMILSKVRPSLYMAVCMMAWAIVSTLTCVVKDYKGMMLCRFFLGLTEAPYYPGALYMISLFYTRKEIATRMSIFYTGNMLASSFSGLIAAGVFAGLDGKAGLEGWRWLFLIQGVVTVVIAVIGVWMLPDTPLKTRWLTPEERQLAHDRIARDTTGLRESTSAWKGLIEACSDYRTWIFCLMLNLHLSANGFKNFLPTVVKTLGFSTTITLVLTCPPYLLGAGISILVAASSGHYNERTWHITISKGIAIVGFVLGCATLNIGARYFAMCLFVGATYGVNNIGIGWVASTLGQTSEKKAVAVALVNALANLSFVYTPYLWPDSDAPRFLPAMMASVAFSAGVVICAWIMRFILARQNRKIRETENEAVNFYAY